MKAGFFRLLALIGATLAGWVVGYVVADARLSSARNDVGGNASADREPTRGHSSARFRDADDATFRTALAEALQESGPLARRRRFSAALSMLRVEEIPDALAMLRRRYDEVALDLSQKVYVCWAEIDPAQAADHALASDKGFLFDEMIMNVWTASAPDAAMQWLTKLRKRERISSLLDSFLSTVATSDPRRALRLRHELSSDKWANPALAEQSSAARDQKIFAAWGYRNGPEAVQEALNLPEISARSQALKGALSGWGSRDLRAALRFASTLPQPFSRIEAVDSLLNREDADPNEVAASILELPAGPLRTAASFRAMDYLPERDPALAQRLIADVPRGELAAQMQSKITSALAASDPEAAAAYLATLPPGQDRDRDFQNLGRTWAESDPEAALEWATHVASAKFQKSAIFAALQTWADHEPASAANWAIAHLSDEKAADILGSICSEWMRSNPAAVLDWALALPRGKSRSTALEKAVGPLAATDPARAVQLFSELPDDLQHSAAEGLATKWAATDPASAAVWALQLAEEYVRHLALDSVIQRWTTDDAPAAEDWVRTMPAGAGRDAVAARCIEAASGRDPARAAGLLPMITDAEQRESSASNLIDQWMHRNKAAARAWLETTSALPPDARRHLLEKFESKYR